MTRRRSSILLLQVRDLLRDLPVFLTSPLYRSWHLRWGSTPAEVACPMPGDALLSTARFQATRAITIDATPNEVWPWLVQMGCGRAGWYSHDLLDNLGRPSAEVVEPRLQQLAVGQWIPMSPGPTPNQRTAFKVDSFEPNAWLLWTKPDSTWSWMLTPLDGGRTRLVTRIHAVYNWRKPFTTLFGVALMELGDFAMSRRMLRGIKTRAEVTHRPPKVHSTSIGSVSIE